MKTIKTVTAAMIISILSIITGCSDQITSSSDQEKIALHSQSLSEFALRLKLSPGEIYVLNNENTSLAEFNELSVLSSVPCFDIIEITAYYEDEAVSLESESRGFQARILMIENLTNTDIELDITLKGVGK